MGLPGHEVKECDSSLLFDLFHLFFVRFIFGIFALCYDRTDKNEQEAKWERVRWWDGESQDSNLGRLQHNSTTCRCAAHKAPTCSKF